MGMNVIHGSEQLSYLGSMRTIILIGFGLLLSFSTTSQTSINWEDAIAVVPSEYGYINLRMVLNSDGSPVILHGKSGTTGGLYCTRWNGVDFDAPVAITSETGLFINDAEGPRMAVSGDRIAVTYQLSGQWATGGRMVLSEDGGATWGTPIPTSPEATEDHFMPVPAFDENQQPWVTVKWGSSPVLEGAQFWDEGSETFLAPVDAGQPMDGDAVCECCASMPFSHDGRNYDVVRNNNSNIRDFWVVRTDVSGSWSEALDIDPTNWSINSCPASEAETCILADGTLLAVFMSAAEGGSRVYWSTADLEAWSLLDSDRIQPGVDQVENNPSVDADGDHSVVAWESNQGGYDILVASGSNSAGGPGAWPDAASVVTEGLSGHSRRPVVRVAGNTVHLVYQRPSEGTFHYRRGTIGASSTLPPLMVNAPLEVSSTPMGWHVSGHTGFHWTVHDLSGRCMASGQSPDGNVSFGETGIYILGITSEMDVQHFKLAR